MASLDSQVAGCDIPCTDVMVSVYAVLLVTGSGHDSHILIGCSAAWSGIQDILADSLSRLLGLPSSSSSDTAVCGVRVECTSALWLSICSLVGCCTCPFFFLALDGP